MQNFSFLLFYMLNVFCANLLFIFEPVTETHYLFVLLGFFYLFVTTACKQVVPLSTE